MSAEIQAIQNLLGYFTKNKIVPRMMKEEVEEEKPAAEIKKEIAEVIAKTPVKEEKKDSKIMSMSRAGKSKYPINQFKKKK